MNADVIEAGVDELADGVEVALGVGPARDLPGDALARDVLGGLLEVTGNPQLLTELTGHVDVRPPFDGRVEGRVLV